MKTNWNKLIYKQQEENKNNIAKIFYDSFLELQDEIKSVDIVDIDFTIESEMLDSSDGIQHFIEDFTISFKYNDKIKLFLKDKNIEEIQEEYEDDGVESLKIRDDTFLICVDDEYDDIIFNILMSKQDGNILSDYLSFLKYFEDELHDSIIGTLANKENK